MQHTYKLIEPSIGLSQLANGLERIAATRKSSGDMAFCNYPKNSEQHQPPYPVNAMLPVNVRKNRVADTTEHLILCYATDNPAAGQKTVAGELMRRGVYVASSTVYKVWQKHNLETFAKRLDALKARIQQEGIAPTDIQWAALEKNKENDIKKGVLNTLYPGYLGTQDTYCPGSISGIGKIYQQTFVDTYSQVAFVKVYDHKSDLVAADLLNDRVLPFYEEQETQLLRITTDRGTEYCGAREHHKYQVYLGIEQVEHSKIETKNPQINGFCDRFHRIMQNEFYIAALWDDEYSTLSQLQNGIDTWLEHYNKCRIMTEGAGRGKTPLQMFTEGLLPA